MRVVEGYFGNGELKALGLFKNINFKSTQMTRKKTDAELDEMLKSEKERNSTVIGISVFDGVKITYTSDGKFSGVIWATRARISGKWEVV